jgi:hypothetical protein
MRRTNGGRWNAIPFRVVPDLGQRPENDVQSPSKQRCHVFQDDDLRSELSNHANDFKEQPASLAAKPCAESGVGNVLTREAPADNVNSLGVRLGPRSHVGPASHVGPMLGENSGCEFVDFNLPLTSHSRSFESKIESSYTGEETSESELF